MKRRALTVMTDRHLYVADDLGPQPLTVAPLDWAGRYAGRGSPELKPEPLAPASGLQPLMGMVSYFLDGLAGGDRRLFGTAFALEVVRVLAAGDSAMRERCVS